MTTGIDARTQGRGSLVGCRAGDGGNRATLDHRSWTRRALVLGWAMAAWIVVAAGPVAAQNLGTCRQGPDIQSSIAACTALIERQGGALVSRERLSYAHYQRALLRRQSLDYAGAIDDFTRSIEFNAKDGASYHGRGEVRALTGLLADAESDLRKALEFTPRSAPAHSSLGRVLVQMGRVQDALAAFDQALAINDRDRGALLGRAMAFTQMQRHEEAERAFETAMARHPEDVEIRERLALARAVQRQRVARAPERPAAPLDAPIPESLAFPASREAPRQSAPAVGPTVRQPAPPPLDAPIPDSLTFPAPRAVDPPTTRVAEGPRRASEPSSAPPTRPERDGARVSEASAPFYCGMVRNWSGHAARYSGVRLDIFGCTPR